MAGNNFVLAVSPERKVVETRNHLWRVQKPRFMSDGAHPRLSPTLRFGVIREKPYRIEGNVWEFRNQDLPPLNQGQGFQIRWNFPNRTFRTFPHRKRMGTWMGQLIRSTARSGMTVDCGFLPFIVLRLVRNCGHMACLLNFISRTEYRTDTKPVSMHSSQWDLASGYHGNSRFMCFVFFIIDRS